MIAKVDRQTRTNAAYGALGMIMVLYRGGDLPKWAIPIARDILLQAGEVVEPVGAEVAA